MRLLKYRLIHCTWIICDVHVMLHLYSHVIVLGDINTSHQKIDHCNPLEDEVRIVTKRFSSRYYGGHSVGINCPEA